MPTPVAIEIFQIARTQVDREAVRRWLDFLGADEFEPPPAEALSDPALLVAIAAKRCYKSFQVGLNPNISRIRTDYAEYIDNILASGHGSVLEHSVFSFAIENVSRVFTGEMNRHRAGWAISEGSMRFIRYGECIPYWLPTSIAGDDVTAPINVGVLADYLGNEPGGASMDELAKRSGLTDELEKDRLGLKKQLSRHIFNAAFQTQEHWYRILEAIWTDELAPDSKFKGKKEITSMMRRIVGMGVATGGVWTGNVRALRHVLTMRASPAAEEEILHVFSRVAKLMRDQEPELFGDFEQDAEGYWRPRYVKV